MTRHLSSLLFLLFVASARCAEPTPIFDGKTFAGWEGDTAATWRIQDGALVGGSLEKKVEHNEFIATTRTFGDFELRLKFKLLGSDGFVNAGVQFRSKRVPNHFEMIGYQADMGEGWWGALYDESRRNKVLAKPIDPGALEKALRKGDWNDYRIRAEGPRLRLWINEVLTVDYTEPDDKIDRSGQIALQIHGGGKAEAWYRDLVVEELVPTQAAAPPMEGPRTADAERAAFRLPQGFVAEIVADESVMQKAVSLNFDTAGRMWVTTASEYPLDGNEQPERAMELYRQGGHDAVLIFDTPWAAGLQIPRLWAGTAPAAVAAKTGGSPAPVAGLKLAMPMGVLPCKDGAILQHGPDLLMLRDTDADGRADHREVLLTGFGIQDSHLMPHGFTRGPGDWIYFAQGAFNSSDVKTREGAVVNARHCKLMRMKPDGSHFEVVGWGLNNIWGFVVDSLGRLWVQEANDMGFPVAPFSPGMAFPGIGNDKPTSHAPVEPPTTRDFTMGGTGLSGLAQSEDPRTWPAPWTNAFMIANPITNRIQAVRAHSDETAATGWRLEKLQDFLVSEDKSFRPVAVQFGPDGSLYIVDWYNKIISHNEVPRTHPERDKLRTRIWRVRWTGAEQRDIPMLAAESPAEWVGRLGSPNRWEATSARSLLSDANLPETILTKLWATATDASHAAAARLAAIDVLGKKSFASPAGGKASAEALVSDPDPVIRREVLRAVREGSHGNSAPALERSVASAEKDPGVLEELIRYDGARARAGAARGIARVEDLIALAPSIDRIVPKGQSATRARLRSLTRHFLEGSDGGGASLVRQYLDSPAAAEAPAEGLVLACLAVGRQAGAVHLAALVPRLQRPLASDELSLLTAELAQPSVLHAFAGILGDPMQRRGALVECSKLSGDGRNATLAKVIVDAMTPLLGPEASEDDLRLAVRLARAHKLTSLEPHIARFVLAPGRSKADRVEGLKALAEIRSERVELFRDLAVEAGAQGDEDLRRDAVLALAASERREVVALMVELWPALPSATRRIALDRLASSRLHAPALLSAVDSGSFASGDLDTDVLQKLQTVLGKDHEGLKRILAAMEATHRPTLRLTGARGDLIETKLDLAGPFTVETWVRLDPGISNEDVLLGSPAGPNFNFYNSQLRVYVGGKVHDALVARTPFKPDMWTHVAITRDEAGHFRIYRDGELDGEGGTPWKEPFKQMDVGRSALPAGTAASLLEFRVWSSARSAAEIRDEYRTSFRGEAMPPALVAYSGGDKPLGPFLGKARLQGTADVPELLTAAVARDLATKFTRFRKLAEAPAGSPEKGHALFAGACAACHKVRDQGGNIGPDLSGAGAMGTESLLRNVLTPNAALESGYYRYDVELKSGDLLSGFLVKEEPAAITLRQIGADDRTIPRSEIRRTSIARRSLMPEGLIDNLPPEQVSDLFAYLRTLK